MGAAGASVDDYLALVEKVDAFARAVGARRADAIRCRAGCSACCEVELSVSEVEAARVRQALAGLSPEAREGVARRVGVRGRCVMLEDDGRCAIYDARPLVCRTQGLPLAYPAGTIPVEAVVGRGGDREITCCPLNFDDAGPRPEDVLDAERVDRTLALVNRRRAEARGEDPLARVSLATLAARGSRPTRGPAEG